MKEFKMRASAASQIMGKRGLGKTGETYIQNWLIEQIYNRRKFMTNKYVQKGIENEDESIDMIADQLGFGMLEKNEQFFKDDFFIGTPDVIVKDLVIDVKNSWDVFTFPHFDEECPNDAYYYQLQVYMKLTNTSKASLIYTLTDTPDRLIEKEARSYCFANNLEPDSADVFEQFHQKMTFADIPVEKRIKVFNFDRDDSVIEMMQERVKECRQIIENKYKIK